MGVGSVAGDEGWKSELADKGDDFGRERDPCVFSMDELIG